MYVCVYAADIDSLGKLPLVDVVEWLGKESTMKKYDCFIKCKIAMRESKYIPEKATAIKHSFEIYLVFFRFCWLDS